MGPSLDKLLEISLYKLGAPVIIPHSIPEGGGGGGGGDLDNSTVVRSLEFQLLPLMRSGSGNTGVNMSKGLELDLLHMKNNKASLWKHG